MDILDTTCRSHLASAISAVGTGSFGTRLEAVIADICPADFCSFFRIGADAVEVVSSSDPLRFGSSSRIDLYTRHRLWLLDPSLYEAKLQLARAPQACARLNEGNLPSGPLKHAVYTDLVDRLLICCKEGDEIFAISVLRWQAGVAFQVADVEALVHASTIICALIGRHFTLSFATAASPAEAFSSVIAAERCFKAATLLSERERQVCSRIVMGRSVPEIAADLRLGSETVRSYVKRAYLRLGISSQRQLLVTYLYLWQARTGRPSDAAVAAQWIDVPRSGGRHSQ